MTFEEVINRNIGLMRPGYEWWPKFIYHYTNIDNAVGILKTGLLMSRTNISALNNMYNDNASRQVIDMTRPEVKSYARFYFRPKTPTQYHNEGYKHPNAKKYDYANVPVPVFFLFSSIDMLNTPGVYFSSCSQAGGGTEWMSGVSQFSSLPFNDIYKEGPMQDKDYEVKVRQAEVAFQGAWEIKKTIKFILCRSEPERKTLLLLLAGESNELVQKYKGLISVNASNMFYKNGVFVQDVFIRNNIIIYRLNDSPMVVNYANQYSSGVAPNQLTIPFSIKLTWKKDNKAIDGKTLVGELNLAHQEIHVKIEPFSAADSLTAELLFDRSLINLSEFALSEMNLF